MSAPFTPAWLSDEPRAVALLPAAVRDPRQRVAAVKRAAGRRVDPAVLAALEGRYGADARYRTHLDRLASGGAACVVTGQQAGLFGGPLYSVHKAAATIRAAQALEAESGVPCVPIFWLQSEDHDYDEIATAHTLQGGAVRSITVPGDPDDAGRAVGDRVLGPGIDQALDALDDSLAGLQHAEAMMALMRRCYHADASPVAAFRDLMDALFAEYGLLTIDPRDPALAAAAAPVHRAAIERSTEIAAVLTQHADALDDAGFRVQVHVRPDAPLSFFHPDAADGPRWRIVERGDDFETCAPTPSPVERRAVLDALVAAPRRFGTSALLRPILQDTWLPTAAYVGGPGEVAYLAQLPPLYAALDLPMPLVVHRARFRIVDPACDRLAEQLEVDIDDLGRPRDDLLAAIGTGGDAQPDPDALENALIGSMAATLARFKPVAEGLDKGLAKSVDKTAETMAQVARRLVTRYRRTLARQDEVATARLDRLLATLQPLGGPQERTLGIPWFAARFGPAALIRAIVDAVVPFDPTLRDLRP